VFRRGDLGALGGPVFSASASELADSVTKPTTHATDWQRVCIKAIATDHSHVAGLSKPAESHARLPECRHDVREQPALQVDMTKKWLTVAALVVLST